MLRAIVFESSSEVAENALPRGSIFVSDCDEEPEMSSSAAPEPTPEPDSDVEQPVSNLKAVFHFANLLTPSAVHLCRSLMSLVSLTMQMSR